MSHPLRIADSSRGLSAIAELLILFVIGAVDIVDIVN